MVDVKELLTRDAATEGSLLIEKKIYDTLIDPVVRTRVGRQFAAITISPEQIKGSSIDIDTTDPGTQNVRLISEGGSVPLSSVTWSSFNVKPDKYGMRIAIVKEMLEDGKWDLLKYNIEQAGYFMAYNEDSLLMSQALDNATNTQAGGAALTISDITAAMNYLEEKDHVPDVMLIGMEASNDLRNIDTFVEANKLGSREMLENGMIGTIFGMKIVRFSSNSTPSTTYSKYAYVIDSRHAYVCVEKRPITIENYDDKTHDIQGAVVTQRIRYRQLRADAICKITTA